MRVSSNALTHAAPPLQHARSRVPGSALLDEHHDHHGTVTSDAAIDAVEVDILVA
jgi:hypothetical protein